MSPHFQTTATKWNIGKIGNLPRTHVTVATTAICKFSTSLDRSFNHHQCSIIRLMNEALWLGTVTSDNLLGEKSYGPMAQGFWAEGCEGTEHASDAFKVGRVTAPCAFLVGCVKNLTNNVHCECNVQYVKVNNSWETFAC